VRNRVPLCGDCHGRIHPWLPPTDVLDRIRRKKTA
jgi:hypothetical protein